MALDALLPVALAVFLACMRSAKAADVRVASHGNTVFDTWDFRCDGSNDRVQIQQALNRAKGGTVWLSDGEFVLNSNLYIHSSNTTLRGHGMNSTVLKLRDNAARFHMAGFIRTRFTTDVVIRDMTLNGNRHNQPNHDLDRQYGRYGVYTEACDRVVIDNLRVAHFFGYGIDPHGVGGVYHPGRYLTVSNCLVYDNGFDGITIDKTEHALVVNNTSVHNARHGINVVTGSRFVELRNNTLYGNGYWYHGAAGIGCGICVQNNQGFGTQSVLIASNTVGNSSKAGVCLRGVHGIRLTANKIWRTQKCIGLNVTEGAVAIEPDNTLQCKLALGRA